MSQILTVANLKGGVGKTTLAINLAGQLTRSRQAVAVVDADAQGTATHWLQNGDGLHNGPTSVALLSLPLETSRGARHWIERVLDIDAAFTVIDCPPHLQAVTEAAIGIADMVVVPVTASGADLIATARALDLVRKARARRPGGAPKCVLVPSKIDFRTSAGREIVGALRELGETVAPAIRQRTAFVDSFTTGQWIGEYAKRSPASREISALATFIRGRLRA